MTWVHTPPPTDPAPLGPDEPAALHDFVLGELSAAELMALAAEHGGPLVERRPEGRCAVSFFTLEERSRSRFRLQTAIDRALPADLGLVPVPRSGLHRLTLELPADLRFSFRLERLGAEGAWHPVDSPGQPRPGGDPRLAEPVAVLPGAAPLGVLDAALRRPARKSEEISIASSALGEHRRVWLSPPVSQLDRAPALVIVFDGEVGHTAPAIRDELEHAGLIQPTAIVLVDQHGHRDRDLTGSPAFTAFLTEELLPRMRKRLAAELTPAQVVLSGSSFGGLCAGLTALSHPHVVGGAIMQSPSAWFSPPPSHQGELRSAPVPALIAAARGAERSGVRLHHEVGTLEFGPPPAQLWQVHGNRWLHDVLVARGFETRYREFAGGHDAAWWRGTFAEALSWMLPARS